MQTVLDYLYQVLGNPTFYHTLPGTNNAQWDYGLMIQYLGCIVLLCVVVSSVFRFLSLLVK